MKKLFLLFFSCVLTLSVVGQDYEPVTGFPHTEDLVFSEDAGHEYYRTFTLDSDRLVLFSSTNGYIGLDLYDSENDYLDGGSSFFMNVPAGTYYVKIYSWGPIPDGTSVTISIDAQINQQISLPHEQSYTFSTDGGAFLLNGNYTFARQFTISERSMVSVSSGQSVTYFSLYSFDNQHIVEYFEFNKILPGGTYYLLIDDSHHHEAGDLVSTISIDAQVVNYTDIQLPFHKPSAVFNSANTQMINGYNTFCYSFEVENILNAKFSGSADGIYFSLKDEYDDYITSGSTYSYVLNPGKRYYLYVDSRNYNGADPWLVSDIDITADPAITYDEVSYSQLLTPDIPATGSIDETMTFIATPEAIATGAGYILPVEAGKHYEITYKVYKPQYFSSYAYLTLLSGLSDGYWNDKVVYHSTSDYNSGELTTTLEYYAETNGNLYILLQASNAPVYSVTAKIVDKTANTLSDLFANPVATIPYSSDLAYTSQGVLDAENTMLVEDDSFRTSESYYCVAYKITLNEGHHIKIHWAQATDAYLYLYNEAGEMVDMDDDGYNNSRQSLIDFTAGSGEGGTYYIVGTTFSSEYKGSYYLTVWNTTDEPGNDYVPAITLAELLAGPVEEIIYSDELSYISNGSLGEGRAALVKSEVNFRPNYYDQKFYAVAYKIELPAGVDLDVDLDNNFDSYIYVYNASGQIVGESYLVYFNYLTSEAGIYYIVVTSYHPMNTGSYALSVWNTAEEPEYPVISSLRASQDVVMVSPNASIPEIMLALKDLTLTVHGDDGTTLDGMTVSMFDWVINDTETQATYNLYNYIPGFNNPGNISATVYIVKTSDPGTPIIHTLSTQPEIEVSEEDTDQKIKQELAKLEIKGDATNGKQVNIANSASYWTINVDGLSATFRPGKSVSGYSYADGLSVDVDIIKVPVPVIYSLSTQPEIEVSEEDTDQKIKQELAKLEIKGDATNGQQIDIANDASYWTINVDGLSATFRPGKSVSGYSYADGLSVDVDIIKIPLPEIISLTANETTITLPANASEIDVKSALSKLVITGSANNGSTPTVQNTIQCWSIEGALATFTPVVAPQGYKYAAGVSTTVTINKTAPALPVIESLAANKTSVQVYTTDSDSEIRQKLAQLLITGTADNTQTVAVPNKAAGWTIQQDGASAVFVPTESVADYVMDGNISLSVTITKVTPVINSLTLSKTTVVVRSNATNSEVKEVLAALTITGNASDGKSVTVPNDAGDWLITSDGLSAKFTPSTNVAGYKYADDLSTTVTIIRSTGLDQTEGPKIQVYSSNKVIYIQDIEIGSELLIYNTGGNLLQRKTASETTEAVSVSQSGMYIVLINKQAVKVLVK